MIDAGTICELVNTYKKHGWLLRRVLLSAGAGKTLASQIADTFEGLKIVTSNIDAAWFSRPAKPGGVSWEVRYLGDIPYALVEKLDEDDPDFEQKLAAVQSRLVDAITAKRNA